MRFLLEWKIVLHAAVNGARIQVNRSCGRQADIDGSGVVDERVHSAAGAVAAVGDVSVRSAGRDLRSGHIGEFYAAAVGAHFYWASVDVPQADRSGQSSDVEVRILEIVDGDLRVGAPQPNITVETLYLYRAFAVA